MRCKLLYFLILLVGVIFNASILMASIYAQNVQTENRKREKFGHTLKKSKRDNKKKTEPINKDQNGKAGIYQQDGDVIRVDTLLVISDVLVTDKQGRPVAGLRKRDFIISENGLPQEISIFAPGDDASQARSIILIIDCSSSQLPYINTSIEAAKTLIDKLNPKDKMAIVTDDISLLTDFTQDKDKLKAALQSLKTKSTRYNEFGASRQYSALMAALKELVKREERTIIIFQTDGDELRLLPSSPETRSVTSLNEIVFSISDVYKEAEKSGATIYPVIPGFRFLGLSSDERISQIKKR